ncbi:MAG: DUF5615 family PIN-like protein [Anaerolineales bacterium]|nr:DUF5615 family PIN-like protein [Anaerolineales bacterium]
MSAIRFLLDENVDPLYRSELLRHEPSLIVWRVGDISAPPDSTLDPDILVWCEERSFLLVTNNRKSMPPHLKNHLAQGRHVPGILVMNPKMSVGEMIEELLLIWGASEEKEYHDHISFLPVSS